MKQTMCKLSYIKKFDMCCPCAAQLQETQLNARIIPADDDCVSVSTFTFLVSMVRAQDYRGPIQGKQIDHENKRTST